MLQVCCQLHLGAVTVRGRAEAQTRGATPRPRSGAAAESARLRSSGQEELPHARGRGGGRQEQADAQGAAAARVQEAERGCFTIKVRRGGREEIPLVQGKEQRLRFAGAAVKRHPTSKARETQVRR